MADFVGYINTEDGDLLIENGTFAKGDSLPSEVRRILLSNHDYKHDPTLRVALRELHGSPITPDSIRDIERRARKALTEDGVRVNEFDLQTGELVMDAER